MKSKDSYFLITTVYYLYFGVRSVCMVEITIEWDSVHLFPTLFRGGGIYTAEMGRCYISRHPLPLPPAPGESVKVGVLSVGETAGLRALEAPFMPFSMAVSHAQRLTNPSEMVSAGGVPSCCCSVRALPLTVRAAFCPPCSAWGTLAQRQTQSLLSQPLCNSFSSPPSSHFAPPTLVALLQVLCKKTRKAALPACGKALRQEHAGKSRAGVLQGHQTRNNREDDSRPEATHLTSPLGEQGLELGQPSTLP